MYLSRGHRIKLSEICNSKNFIIKILAESNNQMNYDISCFGLDENEKCSDERYLIFYNSKKSPCKSITLLDSIKQNEETFEIDLLKLPTKIKKLIFTMTIDGEGTMAQLKQGSLLLLENGIIKGGYKFSGSDFNLEKSIMVAEIYFKDEWRFSAKGVGFNGGLSALLENFGIEEEKNSPDLTPTPTPAEKSKISSFIKGILTAPFKYTENKVKEKNEINALKAKEIEEYNNKKAKEQKFKDLLIDYLSDGILTSDEMQSLDSFCKNNNLYLQECLSQSIREIEDFLHVMLTGIVSDNIITDDEEKTINSVCHFLNPSQGIRNEIDETIKRIKLIEKIKSGNIPALSNNSVITKMGELVWHVQTNSKLIRHLKNETKSHDGEIIVTSERIIFKSYDNSTEILLKNILNFEVDGYNFYIVGKSSKSTAIFRLNESEILGAYVDQALNKFHRKLNFSQTANNTRTIPQTVRQQVWIRDKGECTECRDKQYLEYDHIIPFSKGGSNSENNVQLLCRRCNLKKSDRI